MEGTRNKAEEVVYVCLFILYVRDWDVYYTLFYAGMG